MFHLLQIIWLPSHSHTHTHTQDYLRRRSCSAAMRKKNKLSTPFYRDVVRLKLLDNTFVVVALLLLVVISLLLPCCHGQKHDLRKNLGGKLNANSGTYILTKSIAMLMQ